MAKGYSAIKIRGQRKKWDIVGDAGVEVKDSGSSQMD